MFLYSLYREKRRNFPTVQFECLMSTELNQSVILTYFRYIELNSENFVQHVNVTLAGNTNDAMRRQYFNGIGFSTMKIPSFKVSTPIPDINLSCYCCCWFGNYYLCRLWKREKRKLQRERDEIVWDSNFPFQFHYTQSFS